VTEPSPPPKPSARPQLLLLAVDLEAPEAARAFVEQLAARYAQEIRYCVERGTSAGARVAVGEARVAIVDGVSVAALVGAFASPKGEDR